MSLYTSVDSWRLYLRRGSHHLGDFPCLPVTVFNIYTLKHTVSVFNLFHQCRWPRWDCSLHEDGLCSFQFTFPLDPALCCAHTGGIVCRPRGAQCTWKQAWSAVLLCLTLTQSLVPLCLTFLIPNPGRRTWSQKFRETRCTLACENNICSLNLKVRDTWIKISYRQRRSNHSEHHKLFPMINNQHLTYPGPGRERFMSLSADTQCCHQSFF